MILSAQEAQAMAGWVALFTIRAVQFVEVSEKGFMFDLNDLRNHPLFEGLFESNEIGTGTKGLMAISLDVISQTMPGMLRLQPMHEGEPLYEVRNPAARLSALASAQAEISGGSPPEG